MKEDKEAQPMWIKHGLNVKTNDMISFKSKKLEQQEVELLQVINRDAE